MLSLKIKSNLNSEAKKALHICSLSKFQGIFLKGENIKTLLFKIETGTNNITKII
jgi:hypothetical protein